MLRKTIVFLSVISSIAICSPKLTFADGFRGVEWGSSPETVTESEAKAPASEGDGQLVFEDSIDNLDCYAIFTFVQGQLVRGTYGITEEHANQNDYIGDYMKLKNLLEKKYGEPATDRTIWKDDLYKDRRDDWGMAIATSRLVYNSTWVSGDTDIMLGLYGDNYDIHLTIWYSSISLKNLEKEADELETDSKL